MISLGRFLGEMRLQRHWVTEVNWRTQTVFRPLANRHFRAKNRAKSRAKNHGGRSDHRFLSNYFSTKTPPVF
jgi:hypothetical protein